MGSIKTPGFGFEGRSGIFRVLHVWSKRRNNKGLPTEIGCDVPGNKNSYFATSCNKFQVLARSIGETGQRSGVR